MVDELALFTFTTYYLQLFPHYDLSCPRISNAPHNKKPTDRDYTSLIMTYTFVLSTSSLLHILVPLGKTYKWIGDQLLHFGFLGAFLPSIKLCLDLFALFDYDAVLQGSCVVAIRARDK